MTDLIKQITGDLQKQIEGFEPELNISDIGTVLEAGDGIARVEGLANVKAQELVQFANGVMGTAFNLEKSSVGVIIMGDYGGIVEGMTVRGTGRRPDPVGARARRQGDRLSLAQCLRRLAVDARPAR